MQNFQHTCNNSTEYVCGEDVARIRKELEYQYKKENEYLTQQNAELKDIKNKYDMVVAVNERYKKQIDKIVDIQNILQNGDIYDVKDSLYTLLEELGISFKKTRCKKCLWDYYNIIREELGLIANAADESQFNDALDLIDAEFIYLKSKSVAWNGHIMNQNTNANIIKAFLNTGAKGYYLINKK